MSQMFRQYPQQFVGLLDLTKTLLSVSPHHNATIQNPISKSCEEIAWVSLALAIVLSMGDCLTFLLRDGKRF